jgi:transcription elongation factor Elf1
MKTELILAIAVLLITISIKLYEVIKKNKEKSELTSCPKCKSNQVGSVRYQENPELFNITCHICGYIYQLKVGDFKVRRV